MLPVFISEVILYKYLYTVLYLFYMCAFFMCYTCHLSIYVCLYVIRWGTVHWQYASRGLVSYYLVLCMFSSSNNM